MPVHKSTAAYSFGKSNKPTYQTQVPGPGAYDSNGFTRFTYNPSKSMVKIRP